MTNIGKFCWPFFVHSLPEYLRSAFNSRSGEGWIWPFFVHMPELPIPDRLNVRWLCRFGEQVARGSITVVVLIDQVLERLAMDAESPRGL